MQTLEKRWVACVGVDCGQGRVKDIPIEKNQGVQSLPLGGGRHRALSGEVGAQPFHLRGPKPVRMGHAADVMEIAKYLLALDSLGTGGVVVIAEPLVHLIYEREAGMWAKFQYISFDFPFHMA